MTEIDSPLGKKTFNTKSRQVFTVTDESGNEYPEIPSEDEVRPITSQKEYREQHNPSMDFMPKFDQNTQVQYSHQNHNMMPQYHQNIQQGDVKLSREESLEYFKKRDQVLTEKGVLSDEVKKRVEFLTGICRSKKEVEIDGVKFSVYTLKSGELREITRSVLGKDNKSVDFIFELRAHTLARALFAVNDTPLQYILGGNNIDTILAFIDELDENTVTLLYKCYEELVNNTKEKYGLNTEEDAKEVAEAIKKQ